MRNEGEFAVKNDSKVSILIYNWNFGVVEFKYWVKVEFPLVAEVDTFRLFFGKFYSILCSPFMKFIEADLEFSFCVVHVFSSITYEEVFHKQSTVSSAINVFNNIIYFDTK